MCADWERERSLHRLGVGVESFVFGFLSRSERGAISAAEGGFQIAPDATDFSGRSPVFLDVAHAFLVENRFEHAAKLRAG